MIRKRIIIGGLPRSGSSLLRVLLDASPSILSAAETGFFLRSLDHRKRHVGQAAGRLSRIFHLDPSFIERTILSSVNQISCFDEIIIAFARRNGISKQCWSDKSPRNCEHYHSLARLDPDLYFISTVRDGRSVVTSIIDGRHTYHCTFERFCGAVDAILGFRIERHLIVRYEEEVNEPDGTMRKVFAFVGEPFDPGIFVRYQRYSITRDPSLMNQPMVQQPISKERLYIWQTLRHRARVEQFEAFPGAEERNRSLGYGNRSNIQMLSSKLKRGKVVRETIAANS